MKLVAIGFTGDEKVYIGLSKDEAIKRYDTENPDYTVIANNLSVEEFEVDDSFCVYDIWVEDPRS